MYGYELAKFIRGESENQFELSTLYLFKKRIEKTKWIVSRRGVETIHLQLTLDTYFCRVSACNQL
jgi:DNA-binding PadR family transcriptional regulator